MAGDWIKIESTTPDKPEVFAMADILGIDPDTVVGKLVRFWTWCDQQSLDGNNIPVTETIIDRLTYQPGFSDALRKVDWLEVRSGSLQVPRFDRHNGHSAKARAETNRRVAEHRKKKAKDVKDVTNVTLTPLQKPLPEKRREEKNKREKTEPPPVFQFSDEMPTASAEAFEEIINHINKLAPPWSKRPHWSCQERNDLLANAKAFDSMEDRDWQLMTDYMRQDFEKHPIPGLYTFQPDNRPTFIRKITEMLNHADNWAVKTKWEVKA